MNKKDTGGMNKIIYDCFERFNEFQILTKKLCLNNPTYVRIKKMQYFAPRLYYLPQNDD